MNTMTFTAAELQTLIETMGNNSATQCLLALIEQVKSDETENGTLLEACEYLAEEGGGWNGGHEGAIGVRVRDHENDEDGVEVRWGGGDRYTWCNLDSLLDAVLDGNEVPEWWDSSWTEIWVANNGVHGGYWKSRDALEIEIREALEVYATGDFLHRETRELIELYGDDGDRAYLAKLDAAKEAADADDAEEDTTRYALISWGGGIWGIGKTPDDARDDARQYLAENGQGDEADDAPLHPLTAAKPLIGTLVVVECTEALADAVACNGGDVPYQDTGPVLTLA